jgi:hypothetical protein
MMVPRLAGLLFLLWISGATVLVSHVYRKVEQSGEVFRGCRGYFFGREAVQFREGFCRLGDKCGLISLAARRIRREPGRVGFNQDAVCGHFCGDIAERLSLGVGEIAGKRYEEAEIERALSLLPTSSETMHYATEAGRLPMLFEDFKQVVPGVG